jgi:hypothetical protein
MSEQHASHIDSGSGITEDTILRVRLLAAKNELEASRMRLRTAQAEAECSARTLAMADAVARSMFNREVGPQS